MDWIVAAGFYGLLVCWVVFGATFLFRQRTPKQVETKRAPASYAGMVLQGVAYALVYWVPRRHFSPIAAMLPPSAAIMESAAVVLVGVASVWLTVAAVRALGKQWTYRARIIEGHELITGGPYSCVRNPIYLGMFGMLVASGLAVGRWPLVVMAMAAFLAGTGIRIHSEEKLLREAFGPAFEEYRRRVPAFVPRLF